METRVTIAASRPDGVRVASSRGCPLLCVALLLAPKLGAGVGGHDCNAVIEYLEFTCTDAGNDCGIAPPRERSERSIDDAPQARGGDQHSGTAGTIGTVEQA